jgi:hypothetical protein
MNDWWIHLTSPEKVLWGIAVFTTVVFLIQTLMSMIGGDADSDVSADGDLSADGDHSDGGDDGGTSFADYFTIKNAIAFFLGFSWGTIAMLGEMYSLQTSMVAGAGIGIAMVIVNLLILRGLASLRDSGNANLQNAVGNEGVVSVLVPAGKTGFGKVTVSFSGRQMELMALTDQDRELPRGCPVVVTGTFESRIMVQAIN